MVTNENSKSDCGCFVGLWIDDIRPMPDDLIAAGWCCARSFHEAITKLELLNFKEVSIDHDLGSFYGNREMTGMDIVWWLVNRKMRQEYVPTIIKVHSANPCGHQNMVEAIDKFLT